MEPEIEVAQSYGLSGAELRAVRRLIGNTRMKYGEHGSVTSEVEVTNISKHGLWLLIHEKEIFLPFEQFPWFRDASIGKVTNVELASEQHLYWPDLDVDLELDSVLHPERYPLVSKVQEEGESYSLKGKPRQHPDDE